MSDSTIELADFISDLRSELERALAESKGAKVRFRPGPIELTLQVTAEKSGQAGGKVSFKIFSVGVDASAEGQMKNAAVQILKMTLDPVGSDGKAPILVSDDDGDSF